MLYRPSPAGLALIVRWEKLCLRRYQDVIGVWTQGVGAIRDINGRPVTKDTPNITTAQAMAMLQRDSAGAANAVSFLCRTPLAQGQADALICWVFNLGAARLKCSTLLKRINAEDQDGVAAEWVKWDRAGGLVLHGLRIRREAELTVWRKALGLDDIQEKAA